MKLMPICRLKIQDIIIKVMFVLQEGGNPRISALCFLMKIYYGGFADSCIKRLQINHTSVNKA